MFYESLLQNAKSIFLEDQSPFRRLAQFLASIALLILVSSVLADAGSPGGGASAVSADANQSIGSGDGKIHIIPALSSHSIKNGDRATLQAVIKSQNRIRAVKADIGGIETISLKPAPMKIGGTNAQGTIGLYEAEWTAQGLEEKIYKIKITATDISGHCFTDSSLEFSDPAAGNSNVGNQDYEREQFARIDSCDAETDENSFYCSVVDAQNGYAYFGTMTSPGRVVKVALGSGAEAPSRVGAVTLNTGENQLFSAVIDPANGYAYFGTNTTPGRVVKVALGSGAEAPSRVGAVDLDSGENNLRCAAIAPVNGYAYFGTNTTPGRVVKVALGSGSAAPARVGSVTLDSGENKLLCAVIDPANGYAYFGTDTSPGRVVKVALGDGAAPPSRVGAVTLDSGENALTSAVIDAENNYAYWGTNTNPAMVVKVALGDGAAAPSRAGAVTLSGGENALTSAVIDAENGYAYFGTYFNNPGRVVKIALGDGAAPPSLADTVALNSFEYALVSAAIDTANGYAYFGTTFYPGKVIKVDIASKKVHKRIAGVELTGYGDFQTGVIDAANGYAYFGTSTNPGRVVKVALGNGASSPSWVGAVTLNSGEDSLKSSVIDTANGYAYWGTSTSPGRVIKVALGSGSEAPSRVGAVTLNTGEDFLWCAVIDPANSYAYFGVNKSPGRLVKVALGDGASAPSRIGAVTLNSGEDMPWKAAIDTINGYAYLAMNTSPGKVVKVALGDGAAPPSRVGAVTLNSGEDYIRSADIDVANGYLYIGTNTSPGRVVKVALGDGASPPSRAGALTLNSGENYLWSAVIDPANGYAYFGTDTSPGRVVKVALGKGPAAPTRFSAITLNSGENRPLSAVFDSANGYIYYGTYTNPGNIVKTKLFLNHTIYGTKTVLAEKASINDVRFYSHSASGHVRLAIYDDNGTSRTLLWQSGSISNDKTNDWIIAAIASGTPSRLILNPGTYWLAFNTDSPGNFESATRTDCKNGFLMYYNYAAFPASIANASTEGSNIIFSEYLTYVQTSDLTVASAYGSPVPPIGTTTYGNGTTVNALVNSPVSGGAGLQYVCAGWTGTGDVPASGSGNSCSFVINQNSSLTWNWKTQYELVVTSAHGSPSPSSGWYDSGATISASVASPVSGGEGIQYVCAGWAGTGDAPASGSGTTIPAFTITQPTTITWQWKTQYQLTSSAFPAGKGSTDPANGSWHDSGAVINAQANPISGWQFASWSGDLSGSDNPAALTLDSPKSITAHFNPSLTIISDHGSPSPAGTTYPVYNSTVSASVASPVSGGEGIQYVCAGWAGTGDAPASGSGTTIPAFTITQPTTITWQWKTQYQLTITTIPASLPAGCSLTPSAGTYWYDSGSVVPINATSGNSSRRFIGWSGAITSSNPSELITMDSPKAVRATFAFPTMFILR